MQNSHVSFMSAARFPSLLPPSKRPCSSWGVFIVSRDRSSAARFPSLHSSERPCSSRGVSIVLPRAVSQTKDHRRSINAVFPGSPDEERYAWYTGAPGHHRMGRYSSVDCSAHILKRSHGKERQYQNAGDYYCTSKYTWFLLAIYYTYIPVNAVFSKVMAYHSPS